MCVADVSEHGSICQEAQYFHVRNVAATYIAQANEGYRQALAEATTRKEAELIAQHQARIEKEEKKLRILEMLNRPSVR